MEAFKSPTMITGLLLFLLNINHGVKALRCGDCAADCGSPGVCETKGKCFLRRDVNGLIYRGCADGKRWNGLLYTYNGCQFQNYLGWNGEKVYWCFCDEDNCNDERMEVLQEKYGVHPLSVGPLNSLLGPARPTNVGPMSDFTHETRFQDVPQGRIERQGQVEGQGQDEPSGVKGQDITNIGLQGFERKLPSQELTGIPRFQTAGEKSPDERNSKGDSRFTSDPKFNAFSPTNSAPQENYLPQKREYFRYVPSDPDYVQVAPGQGPMTREALLEVLRQNGYDITQHTNDTTNGAGGVVLTFKSPDGASRETNSGTFRLPPDSNPGNLLAPGDILSFLNNLRTEGNNGQAGAAVDAQNNPRVGTNDALNILGRISSSISDASAGTETTTRATLLFTTSSETKYSPETVSLNNGQSFRRTDNPEQFLTTTESPQASSSRKESLFKTTPTPGPYVLDDIVPPTQSVNFLDLLNSMKKGDDGDVIDGQNVTSPEGSPDTATMPNVTASEEDEDEIPNYISKCPQTWIYDETQHSCYKIERQRKSFHEASYNCSQYDSKAHLVSIETEEEYKFIVYQLQEQEKHLNGWQGWWTSGVYDPSIREFTWLNTGFVISRLNPMWHPDLLMTPFQQTCVWLVPNAGHPLGNYGCSQSSGFICELELT